MQEYLDSTEIIDWHHPQVSEVAQQLAMGATSKADIARRCFEFVRDEIKHSVDFNITRVTLIASDVLRHKTGVCYAKSHLLAALLRANNIPSALCYQRLHIGGNQFCLHGLNAIWLDDVGWFRVDARGNKPGVDAEFSPLNEKLAFTVSLPGEIDSRTRHTSPMGCVIESLRHANTAEECLPDDANLA